MSFSTYLGVFLAGYTAVVLGFYTMSLVIPKAGFVARSLAAYIGLIICAIYGVVASIVLRILGKEQIAQWTTARAFKYLMAATTGVTFVVEDPNNVLGTTRPAVFIGPHQTELDVLMLGCIFPKYCSVTAKSSLKKVPFLGWFMTLSGTVFIDRKNSKDARSAMAGAAAQMKDRKQSVYMFPEGTRSYAKDPMLLPFKKGAFHLAVQAGVPIVPVVVANYSHVLYLKDLTFNAGKVPVKVLDPIPTEGLTAEDVDELTRSTRELMLKEMVALTEKAQKRAIAMPSSTSNGTGNGVVRASGVEATISSK
ncbi:acyltransferase [Microdochium trichocladiopsis]|uniref:1-acyl-sn-glycerol-3-phosphate acyltransferase n=1 Tax=Microdochium trichocladiopsis TaxID=1682393 RepID=A0A9P9BUI3_9PEZI|nr:acyltransferase [Microdochium trichocladiopsis]KAH7038172.1 acyltransferase [Microdochium trichocladiopsis]